MSPPRLFGSIWCQQYSTARHSQHNPDDAQKSLNTLEMWLRFQIWDQIPGSQSVIYDAESEGARWAGEERETRDTYGFTMDREY